MRDVLGLELVLHAKTGALETFVILLRLGSEKRHGLELSYDLALSGQELCRSARG